MRSERRSRLIPAFLLLAALPAAASTFIVTDDELDPAVFPAVAERFQQFDVDHNGSLSREEFSNGLKQH